MRRALVHSHRLNFETHPELLVSSKKACKFLHQAWGGIYIPTEDAIRHYTREFEEPDDNKRVEEFWKEEHLQE